jgi:hypothetical protein
MVNKELSDNRGYMLTYVHIEVKPISGSCGTGIQGVDLSQPVGNAAFSDVHDALVEQLLPVGA